MSNLLLSIYLICFSSIWCNQSDLYLCLIWFEIDILFTGWIWIWVNLIHYWIWIWVNLIYYYSRFKGKLSVRCRKSHVVLFFCVIFVLGFLFCARARACSGVRWWQVEEAPSLCLDGRTCLLPSGRALIDKDPNTHAKVLAPYLVWTSSRTNLDQGLINRGILCRVFAIIVLMLPLS